MFNPVLALAFALATMCTSPPQAAGPFELAVRGAGSRGTLVFTASGVSFEAADSRHSRQWPYHELKQIRVVSPREVAFDTFEDGSRWRFGADRTIEFDVTGDAVNGSLVAFLLEHVERPLTSAVLPAGIGEPRTRIDAKHLRGRKGTHGTIAVYATGLAYEATGPADSRYWRFADVESILRTSQYTLLIGVYERGRVRSFAFELKSLMPDEEFAYLWNQVNRPMERTGSARGAGRSLAPGEGHHLRQPATRPIDHAPSLPRALLFRRVPYAVLQSASGAAAARAPHDDRRDTWRQVTRDGAPGVESLLTRRSEGGLRSFSRYHAARSALQGGDHSWEGGL